MATKKSRVERPYEKNRKAAAKALYDLAKAYENVTLKAVYAKCYYSKRLGCWRYIGKAHDYSF